MGNYRKQQKRKLCCARDHKRPRCREPARNKRLMRKDGIALRDLQAALVAQRGACACCGEKLGRVIHVDQKGKGDIGLLCPRCPELVATTRHIREHARAFEAFFKKHGMTRQLALHRELMQIWGMKPTESEAGGNQAW
jgi:hypothetical protein